MPDQDAFERIDVDQPDCDPVQLRLHTARYEFACGFAAGKRVLDMACGTGFGAAMLAKAGAVEVVGIDLDQPAIDQARKRFGADSIAFTVGDAEAPIVAGLFDVIASFETIEHLMRPDRFLVAVQKLLALNSVFIVSTPCRRSGSLDDRPANPFHVREWNQPEFTELLGRYFRDVTMHGQWIEFAKNALPLNRTLARIVTALVAPRRLRNLHSCSVRPLDDLPLFRTRMNDLVAVCRNSM